MKIIHPTLPNDTRKLFFIHNPRTGGSSIKHTIKDCAHVECKIGIETHFTMYDLIYKYKEDMSKYITFSVVRNPWDRIISIYNLMHYHNEGHKKLFNAFMVDFWYYRLHKAGFIYGTQLERWTDNYRSDGNVLINYILNFENLEEDWKTFAKMFDLPPLIKEKIKSSIPYGSWKNSAKDIDGILRGHYSKHHTNDTKEQIEMYFKPDIDYFNYIYDECTT